MNNAATETFRLHLLKRQTHVLERSSIRIDRLSIRTVDDNQLRYGVDNAEELVFILPALLLCLFCCGEVRHSTYKFKIPRRGYPRASRKLEVLDRTVRHQQTVFKIKVGSRLSCPVESLLRSISIVGMNSSKYHLQRRL